MGATKAQSAVDAAAFAEAVERERKLTAFREGRLPFVQAEMITSELCAQGDAVKRAAAEQATREERERAARRRQGGI
jgi:hypothetical protein